MGRVTLIRGERKQCQVMIYMKYFTYIIEIRKIIQWTSAWNRWSWCPRKTILSAFLQFHFFCHRAKTNVFFPMHIFVYVIFLSVSVLYLAAVGTFSPPHKLVFISSSKCIYRCVCLFSMKNRLKLLQRISFLIFAIRSNFYCTTNTTKMQKNKIVEDE